MSSFNYLHIHRTNFLQTYNLLCHPKGSIQSNVAEIMLRATNEERGTVAGLAALSQALDDEHVDGEYSLILSGRALILTDRGCTICAQSATPNQTHVHGHVPPTR